MVAAWKGGSIFASSEPYPSQAVTREQYKEGGHAYCRRKFLAQSILTEDNHAELKAPSSPRVAVLPNTRSHFYV